MAGLELPKVAWLDRIPVHVGQFCILPGLLSHLSLQLAPILPGNPLPLQLSLHEGKVSI